MEKKKIYIKGMRCVSCEKILEDEFLDIPNVKKVDIDHIKGEGTVESEDEVDFLSLKSAAEKMGYALYEHADEMSVDGAADTSRLASFSDWTKAVLIVIALALVFRFFQGAGIIDRLNFQGKTLSFGVAFLVGIIASLSSCLVIVGSVVIALGEKYRSNNNGFYHKAIKPNMFFHIGRAATFFVLGGFLGLIGGKMNISGGFISIFTIIIAAVMGWLGVGILVSIPSISNLGIGLPKGITKKWSQLKKSDNKYAPFLLGGLSFFLPCGFTQSMQIFALASGSFWVGGLTLLMFAAGTLPVLMSVGVATAWMKSKKVIVFQKVAGMLIVLFAFFTLQSGLALQSFDRGAANRNNVEQPKGDSGMSIASQVVEMRVKSGGFSPASLKIKKGVPVEWVIRGDSITGCTSKIIVPSLGISQELVSGKNVVKFTPTKSGTIPFSCWMGMVRGEFIVE